MFYLYGIVKLGSIAVIGNNFFFFYSQYPTVNASEVLWDITSRLLIIYKY